jgi:hypothetical protein
VCAPLTLEITAPASESPNDTVLRLAEEFHQRLKTYKGSLQCDVEDWGTPVGGEILDRSDENV